MISALICDDHRLFGESFAHALRGHGVHVTATSCPQETLTAIERVPVDRVVMNVLFPQASGFEAIKQIRRTWPATHVSCVGAEGQALLRSAMDAGAHAVLSKKRPLSELVDAVIDASWIAGRLPPSPAKARNGRPAAQDYPLAAQFLTNREREVLRLLVCAKPTECIAAELGISVTTTRGYVQSILEKFGVHSRVEAVAYAVRHSVVI
jgi:two-component system nitrate/nitrite response regulator NarL